MCQSPFYTRYSVLNISGVYSSHRSCKLLRGTDPLTSQRKLAPPPCPTFNWGIRVKSKWLRNTTKFYRCFTNATRPRRRRLTDALGQHAALRTRIFPTLAHTLATAPDPCARAAQHPPRSAHDAI